MTAPLPAPLTVILNPHARQGKAAGLAGPMADFCAANGIQAALHTCGTEADLQRVFANLPRGSRVVGVGGDGTNHRLLPYLLAGAHEYGIVPYGSGDDLARALGVFGLSWQDALRHAANPAHPATPIDVGLASCTDTQGQSHSRHFLGCFLLGIDGYINNQTASWKFKGPLPYFFSLLKALPTLRGWRMGLRWQNEKTEPGNQSEPGKAGQVAPAAHILCSVLNTPTYGSGYPIAPMTRLNDGTLTLMHAPLIGRLRFLQLFFKMLKGLHVNAPECHFAELTELRVESEDLLSTSADGEVIAWHTRSMEVRVLPGALKVVTRTNEAFVSMEAQQT